MFSVHTLYLKRFLCAPNVLPLHSAANLGRNWEHHRSAKHIVVACKVSWVTYRPLIEVYMSASD